MDNEAKLNLMKKRVIGSFKWQEDIIIPFSKEFGCIRSKYSTKKSRCKRRGYSKSSRLGTRMV